MTKQKEKGLPILFSLLFVNQSHSFTNDLRSFFLRQKSVIISDNITINYYSRLR